MSTTVQTEMLASLNPATGDVVGEVAVTPVRAIPGIVSGRGRRRRRGVR